MSTDKVTENYEIYGSVIIPMAREAGIPPWRCVMIMGSNDDAVRIPGDHPNFNDENLEVTFCKTIIDQSAVFAGDELYYIPSGKFMTMANDSDYELLKSEPYNFSWKAPTINKTYDLAGIPFTDDELTKISSQFSKLGDPASDEIADKIDRVLMTNQDVKI